MDSKQFIKDLIVIKNSWLNKGYSTEEAADGIIFSILSYIDGCSSLNDFKEIMIRVDGKNINAKDFLHEMYHSIKAEEEKST